MYCFLYIMCSSYFNFIYNYVINVKALSIADFALIANIFKCNKTLRYTYKDALICNYLILM